MIAPAQGAGASQYVCRELVVLQVSQESGCCCSTCAPTMRTLYPPGPACACCCLKFLDGFDQFVGHGLAIAIQHAGVVTEEQCIFHAGEALALAALDDDDIL